MLIENSDALKKFLMESLGRISDADPGALTRYILALLKKPRSEADLKVFFLDQLEVFLMKDTQKFVEQLFDAIKSKSYLPAAHMHTGVQKPEKIESNEKDSESSENIKVKKERREKSRIGAERNRSRSRSSSPDKNKYVKRLEKKNSLSTHIYEPFLKDGATFVSHKNREIMPPTKLSPPLSESAHSLANTVTTEYIVQQSEKQSRCKDYDERGYCLLGDSCRFNHGLDPLIVEDVSVLNFAHVLNDTVQTSLPSDEKEAPLPPPPPPPPPPPTSPPPLPTTGIEYIPEPYNPECPSMVHTMGGEKRECDPSHTNYYSLSLPRSFQVPSLIPQKPLQSSILKSRVQQNSKPIRSRELIGVPTVDDCKEGENRKNELQLSLANRKRKGGFDYNRLGPKKPKRIICDPTNTLELRRVPASLNTITDLHNHFSTFGKITNIQVCYDNDPEAALVTFATAAEATAAYKSTEAVLNNRFIKVFLHETDKRVEKNRKEDHFFERDRNLMRRVEDNLSYTDRDFRSTKKSPIEIIYSKGNLSKTVFLNNNKSDVSSVSAEGKSSKDDKKHALNNSLGGISILDLYRKKQEVLETQIRNQKLLVERFKETKSPKQRIALKKIIEDVASKIGILQNELKVFFEKEKCNSPLKSQKSVIAERKKELLDAEMDLYKTLNKGDDSDTTVLLRKVNELKERAKAYGLLDSPYEKSGLKIKRPKTVPPHGVCSKSVPHFSKLLKTDNRPKTLLVSGIEDKDFLINFLQKYPGVEKITSGPRGCIVVLSSRKEAEKMNRTLNGFTLGNENLMLSWIHDDQQSASDDVKDAKEKNDSINFVDEDEDEEEDSEARSWRR